MFSSIRQIATRARPLLDSLVQPRVFLPVLVGLYLVISLLTLGATVRDPKGRANLLSGDTGHYLDIAQGFAAGDFSMSYVQARPHRQPLYPLLLAPVYRWGGGGLFALATVNIALATVTLAVAYLGLRRLTGRNWVAAVVTVLLAFNDFLFSQTTTHLLTEPVHVLLMLGIIFAVLRYLERRQGWVFLVAAGLAGLDYLARPNGLFVMAAMGTTVAGAEVIRWWRAADRSFAIGAVARKGLLYAGAIGIFLLLSAPSWVPREHYFGIPFYHGYLSNYLWVDTYKEGHVGQKVAIYTWRDYVRTHTLGDAIGRGLWGFWCVGFSVPWRVEDNVPVLFLLALGGWVTGLIRGPTWMRVLVVFAFIQLLPLMWTSLSNPTVRVPYASTLPFEVVFAGFFLAWLADVAWLRRFWGDTNRQEIR